MNISEFMNKTTPFILLQSTVKPLSMDIQVAAFT